jgi:HEAT repeat protein
VEELLKAANLCGKPDATLNEIKDLLDDPDPGVRFWAVMGFYAAGEVDREVRDKLAEMLQDPSPTVALAAAELICHMGRYDRGLPVIADGLRDADHPTRVLQAAIAARNLKAYASELLPVIEDIYPAYRGEVWDRYRNWVYPMFIGFALDQTYLNCGLEIPE